METASRLRKPRARAEERVDSRGQRGVTCLEVTPVRAWMSSLREESQGEEGKAGPKREPGKLSLGKVGDQPRRGGVAEWQESRQRVVPGGFPRASRVAVAGGMC